MFIKEEKIGNFVIKCYAEPEYESLESMLPDDTEEQITEMYKQIDRGEIVYFTAKVVCELNGVELATDYLCGCIYESYEEFYDADGDYYSDMKSTVLNDARTAIKNLIVLSEMQS